MKFWQQKEHSIQEPGERGWSLVRGWLLTTLHPNTFHHSPKTAPYLSARGGKPFTALFKHTINLSSIVL
jgi:hypothetical protein